MRPRAEVWRAWKRDGILRQVAALVRAEWECRFFGIPIEGERVVEGYRLGGVHLRHDRTGGGDFIRALARSGRGHYLRLVFYPDAPADRQAYWTVTTPKGGVDKDPTE